jgi:hypothetical protein
MSQINSVAANGADNQFKVTGSGFGSTQATYTGSVYVSTNAGAIAAATISTWSDTQITGTLPSGYRTPNGKLHVMTKIRDFGGAYHPVSSNVADYTF